MNNKTKNLAAKDISRAIFTRFFIAIIIYSIIIAITLIVGYYIATSFIWHGDELLYFIFKLIENYLLYVLVACWLFGFVIIFSLYWYKTLKYMDTIVEASYLLVTPEEDFIHLPKELKEIEDRMNQIKQEALRNARLVKESEQRKNDLIVYLAHDLKTPLTSVIGYLTLLRDEAQISEELREKYLSISLEKAERLEDLINEFFEITRFNLNQLTLEPSRVNLTRMLEQITFEFKPLLADKNLQCTLRVSSDLEMSFDVDKMQRVFDNLIRNAINYSYENSTIEVVVEQKQEGAYLYFKNHGNTIPKEKLNRIFEQFFRLDTSRGTKTGGAGLGLAIAKEIVERHNGTITASSENDMIEFLIFLPIPS